jgi:hypothetical protein
MKYSWLFIFPIFAIIAIVAYSIYHHKTGQQKIKKSVLISHSKKIRALPEYEKASKKYRILLCIAAVALVFSIASITITASRPISVDIIEPDYETRDIMLCIDVSGSQATEIANVILYFSNVVGRLKGQRIGVGVFAEKATILSPLTNDYAMVENLLKELVSLYRARELGVEHNASLVKNLGSASAIGPGIINCASGFDKLTEDGRAQSMIVATDNLQNVEGVTAEQAGNYLARYGITLYAIDTIDADEVSVDGARDPANRAASLRRAAGATGGLYYNLPTQGINGEQAAESIMKQEAAKHENVAQFIQTDSPKISTALALVSVIVMLVAIWRLKL